MNEPDPGGAVALIAVLVQFGIPLLLLFIWWAIGHTIEKRHLASLLARESAVGDILLSTLKTFPHSVDPANPAAIVNGEVAIASDAFKRFVFGLRNIFGGESGYYSLLFARARREALLRMIGQAKAKGYDAICNIRFDSVDIGGNASGTQGKRQTGNMAVCMVSGTAYRRANLAGGGKA
ncbi:MAG: heavy metal-binding domain-containing protein [Kiritimatiellae bacterium]|nr:heavy metal-binding domain-containing protein [Kiritimatiellia bacterium]MBP5226582.1 heavy metal-binding domain-containing protein [Kiritimatiellia bacterium]